MKFIELHCLTMPTKSKEAQKGKSVLASLADIVEIKENAIGSEITYTNGKVRKVYESKAEIIELINKSTW